MHLQAKQYLAELLAKKRLKQNNPFENTETGKDFGLGQLFQSYTHNTGYVKK